MFLNSFLKLLYESLENVVQKIEGCDTIKYRGG